MMSVKYKRVVIEKKRKVYMLNDKRLRLEVI